MQISRQLGGVDYLKVIVLRGAILVITFAAVVTIVDAR